MPAFAQTGPQNRQGGWTGGHGGASAGMAPGVFGTVSALAVNGDVNTFVVTARTRPQMGQATTTDTTSVAYTVDASNAKIYKGSATSTVSVSGIAVGDTVMVQGTVSGTNIAATVIRDGAGKMMQGRPGSGGGAKPTTTSAGQPEIMGNGEPVIGGSVAAIGDASLTVTNPSNVTYTVGVASTTIVKNGTNVAFSDIAVGDNVIVQGAVNGTSVTASSIIDQGTKGTGTSSSDVPPQKSHGAGLGASVGGFFGAIGGFFQHLFGF